MCATYIYVEREREREREREKEGGKRRKMERAELSEAPFFLISSRLLPRSKRQFRTTRWSSPLVPFSVSLAPLVARAIHLSNLQTELQL